MAKIISLVNQKGGVGKTTTSINLSASLGKLGKKTLLVDLDPQGNATTGLGINKGELKYSIYDVLTNKCNINEAIIKTKFTNLYILPATIFLAGLNMELVRMEYADPEFKKNSQLKNVLANIVNDYDYIIIDCPPSLEINTINALVASNSILIPVQSEFLPLEGVTQLMSTVLKTQKELNRDLTIEGVLLTMFDSRTNLAFQIAEQIRKYFGDTVFNTIISRSIRLAESPSFGEPICEYDPTCRATEAYFNLAKEVIERDGN